MTTQQWLTIFAALLGGGAMGAIITTIVTNVRGSVQPVGHRVEFIQVFREKVGLAAFNAQLKLSDGVFDYHFDNLFIARVTLSNRGNRDIEQFTFGITLSEGNNAIYVEPKSPDRHHVAVLGDAVSLSTPVRELDFILKPFNRYDVYSFDVFLVLRGGTQYPNEMRFSSPHSIRFVDLPSISEVTESAVEMLGAFFARALRHP